MAFREISSRPIPLTPKAAQRPASAETAPKGGADFEFDALTLTGIVPAPVGALPPFRYKGVALPKVTELNGSEANALITRGYHELDQAFSSYLGEPAVANWLTFGKYASREAGVQIAELESALGSMRFEKEAIKQTIKGLTKGQRLEQSLKLFVTEGRYALSNMLKADTPQERVASLNIKDLMAADIAELNTALVAGNKGVYQHIAPAFDLFMKTEAAGQDGIAALKTAGFGPGTPKDPQGFVLEAFGLYKEARAMRTRLSSPDLSSYERLELTALRQNMIGRANMLMVVNEQWTIVQSPEIFGDPDIARLTRAMEGTMTIVDAMGEHALLPRGGNWTDFTTRMGFKEVPRGKDPEAITIVDEQGKRHDYVPENFDRREGTIYTYFTKGLSEEASRKLITAAPEPIPGVKTPVTTK